MNYISVFIIVYITIFQNVKAEDNIKLTRSDENSDENMENTEGMIRLSPPTLDEEEQNSPHMPRALRCDGCRAVAYQLSSEFNRRQKNLVKKKKLSESDVIEIVEKVCSNGFENYGLKGVDGVNRLSGPGLETEKSPGMMQGGGRWPIRLQNICNAYVGELEEEGIYEGFLEDKTLEDYLCRREGLFGYCKDTPPPKKVEL
ncbi:marginal zone B- and B1-cell-specific protein-like [Crassostrea virginica]